MKIRFAREGPLPKLESIRTGFAKGAINHVFWYGGR